MNSYSTKVQLNKCMEFMRNQHMKYIANKGINSVYGTPQDTVLFGEDKISQKNIRRHDYTHERRSKKQ